MSEVENGGAIRPSADDGWNTTLQVAQLVCALGLVAGCSTAPSDTPARIELAAVEQPAFAAESLYHEYDVLAGEETSWRVVSVDGDLVRGLGGSGCAFSFRDAILPVLSWDNCDGSPGWTSGTRTYTSAEGSLWPLRVGNTARYELEWTGNGGETDTGSLDCEVDQTAHITTRAGEMDAYRIVCLQRWEGVSRTRVTYWVPGFGAAKVTDTHSKRGTTSNTELLRVERPI